MTEYYSKIFYETLYSALSDETNENNETNNENNEAICLISKEPLNDSKITLFCNHSFNYKWIFDEVYNQKKKPASTEIQRVKPNQIKCPYCRRIQNGILPPKLGFDNVTYVNKPLSMVMLTNECKYVYKSGKKKGLLCKKKCIKSYCYRCDTYLKKKLERLKQKELKNKLINKKITTKKITNDKLICPLILMSGKRKGQKCGAPSKINGKCGRHKHKILT